MVGFLLAFNGDKYVLLALGTVIYCYGGLPFLKGMIGEVKAKAIGMMTLVAIAISVAYVYSVAVVFGLQGMDFFWELATLIDIMLLGHWLEMRSQMAASRALQSLVALPAQRCFRGTLAERSCKDKARRPASGETAIINREKKFQPMELVTGGAILYQRGVCLPGKVFP